MDVLQPLDDAVFFIFPLSGGDWHQLRLALRPGFRRNGDAPSAVRDARPACDSVICQLAETIGAVIPHVEPAVQA